MRYLGTLLLLASCQSTTHQGWVEPPNMLFDASVAGLRVCLIEPRGEHFVMTCMTPEDLTSKSSGGQKTEL